MCTLRRNLCIVVTEAAGTASAAGCAAIAGPGAAAEDLLGLPLGSDVASVAGGAGLLMSSTFWMPA